MTRFWQLLLGIDRSPGAPAGGESRLEFAAWPKGAGTIVLIVAAIAIGYLLWRLYRVSWDEGRLGNQLDAYAANPDPRESNLDRISADEVKTLLAPLDVEIASAKAGGSALFSPTGREIWRDLACGLFVLLLVESIFATWAGRSR